MGFRRSAVPRGRRVQAQGGCVTTMAALPQQPSTGSHSIPGTQLREAPGDATAAFAAHLAARGAGDRRASCQDSTAHSGGGQPALGHFRRVGVLLAARRAATAPMVADLPPLQPTIPEWLNAMGWRQAPEGQQSLPAPAILSDSTFLNGFGLRRNQDDGLFPMGGQVEARAIFEMAKSRPSMWCQPACLRQSTGIGMGSILCTREPPRASAKLPSCLP